MPPENPDRPEISVVVPLFNEEENVDRLIGELATVLDATGDPFEIVLVDDGSDDGTWRRIVAVHRRNPSVRGLRLLRNFGHQHALLAGLEHARGRAVITMDGDLQHPPEFIPELLGAWREGHRLVQTQRRDSTDTGIFKRLTSRAFYRVFSLLSGISMKPGMSDFRLLDASLLSILLDMREPDLFLRGSLQWIGASSVTLPYQARPRTRGKSKFTMGKMIRLSTRALVSFSTIPLKLGIWLGIFTSGLAFLEILYILYTYARGDTVPGWASVLTVVSFMFGVLFILLGILGTYLASIHRALKDRPRYLLGDAVGGEFFTGEPGSS